MDPRIQQMQKDLQAFRATKSGGSVPTTTPQVAAPSPAPAPTPSATTTPSSGIRADLEGYRQQKRAGGSTYRQEIPKDPNMLAEFAKGIFSAPTTLVARPFQAAAAVAGASNDQIDEFTNRIPIIGDLVADAPDTFADVKKDVGRGIQTVALGTGAPLAGGAAFGVGSSLEQGNDLLSAQTAINAALGAGAGKVASWVGKPLLDATGKVVGVITPKTIKDVAAKGAGAIQEFAATHQLLGGIAAKPSAALAKGFQNVDDAVGSVFKGGGAGASGIISREYPQLNPQKHFQEVNARDIKAPTTINEPKYAKATRVYNDAKSKGIDLEEVANRRGIIHDKIAEGGRYNTLDTVDNIRQGNYEVSDRIARPAIKAAEPGVPLVPVKDVRAAMIKKVNDIPDSQVTPEDRAKMLAIIHKRYSPEGAMAQSHPNGLTLTNLHDNRIISQKNGGYKMGQSASDALKAQLSREEGRVFADIFDKTIPEEVGMQAFRKELEQNFLLADYLESLHNKAIPANITKKAVRLFGKAIAATVGGKIGGFPGAILGSQYGDMAFSAFQALPNPIKMRVLQNIKVEDPKIFKEIIEYIGKQDAEMLMRLRLPAPGQSSFKETPPTIFSGPGGKASTNRGEAFDVADVESGKIKSPGTDRRLRSYLIKRDQAQSDPYYPADLPVIKAGRVPKKPRGLNDIFID
jgi:hypothetical protein